MQKSEIADSVSLLTACTAIFDFYTAKAVHEQAAKLFEVAWTEECRMAFLSNSLYCLLLCYKGEIR